MEAERDDAVEVESLDAIPGEERRHTEAEPGGGGERPFVDEEVESGGVEVGEEGGVDGLKGVMLLEAGGDAEKAERERFCSEDAIEGEVRRGGMSGGKGVDKVEDERVGSREGEVTIDPWRTRLSETNIKL